MLNNERNLDEKELSWRHHTYWFSTIPPGYSNQNIIDLIGEFYYIKKSMPILKPCQKLEGGVTSNAFQIVELS